MAFAQSMTPNLIARLPPGEQSTLLGQACGTGTLLRPAKSRRGLSVRASSNSMQRQHQASFGLRHNGPALRGFTGERTSCSARCSILYTSALELARCQDYAGARDAFQQCVELCPDFTKAWVSWAQLEKRVRSEQIGDHLDRCRTVLQRGLFLNPNNARLCQAWGLFELQRGNVVAAVLLLERCVAHDPSCSPVLKWKAVRVAQQTVTLRRQRSLSMQSNLNNFA